MEVLKGIAVVARVFQSSWFPRRYSTLETCRIRVAKKNRRKEQVLVKSHKVSRFWYVLREK